MTAIPLERDVEYPESDGRPMGETDFHRKEIMDLLLALEGRYELAPDVYVAGDLFLYFQRGNARAVVCPDVFLVRGVPKGNRRIYKLWEEGPAPALVIEVTSKSTREEDLIGKKQCYARLGVEEYFLHDPLAEYLSPTLQGYRLAGDLYRGIDPEPDGTLASVVTGLVLRTEGPHLRLFDGATGERLATSEELRAQARAAEARAEAAEAELARLREELKLRSGSR